MTMAQLQRAIERARKRCAAAMEARMKLPAGSSRARVTTANARWARACEHRDRLLDQLVDAITVQP